MVEAQANYRGQLFGDCPHLVVIGDIHGSIADYKLATMLSDASIQIGDFGFGFFEEELPTDLVDPEYHRVFVGNHDNRALAETYPWVLPQWGWFLWGKLRVFYVSGGESPDRKYRIPGRSWWPDEELSYRTLQDMIDTYRYVQPQIMLTHEAPESVTRKLVGEGVVISRTSWALEDAMKWRRPMLWLFGHHHRTWRGPGFLGLTSRGVATLARETFPESW